MSTSAKLRLALLQTEQVWEDSEANLSLMDHWLKSLKVPVDLIVLPEMFNTAFTMNAESVAQTMEGPAVRWLVSRSEEYDTAICASMIIAENGEYYNRYFHVVKGKIEVTYDKRHRFRMAGEHTVFSAGKDRPEIELAGWKIMPRVCYDLRFPVWNRSYAFDLQVYVANWPAARVDAWDKLLMSRAIENQCYVVGVNRIGTDGKNIEYSGHSIVIDPKGNALTPEKNESRGWIYAEIEKEPLEDFRKNFPLHMDADLFRILE